MIRQTRTHFMHFMLALLTVLHFVLGRALFFIIFLSPRKRRIPGYKCMTGQRII